jgi:ribonuclease HI
MGVPAVLQCRIFSHKGEGEYVSSWTLPVWVISMASPSVGAGLGSHEPGVYVNKRIADAMNIKEGDSIEIEILVYGDRLKKPVTIKENMSADVLVYGAIRLGLVKSESISAESASMVLKSGREIDAVMQEMWAGMKISSMHGVAVLYFDGASRNNPKGPAGYGFSIVTGHEEDLIRGYGYYKAGSNNEMEYKGLLEGLIWALRLDVKVLSIRGDSELVINQCNGEYQVRDAKLRVYYQQIKDLMKVAKDQGTNVSVRHITRDKNIHADSLANLGIDSQSHATICNWDNINKMCSRTTS